MRAVYEKTILFIHYIDLCFLSVILISKQFFLSRNNLFCALLAFVCHKKIANQLYQ